MSCSLFDVVYDPAEVGKSIVARGAQSRVVPQEALFIQQMEYGDKSFGGLSNTTGKVPTRDY
ncbi:MAG: hypothetical protein LBN10_09030 [Propionibacteriaceae bacterium]|nr:hypothetical protein [Propionibacteriaceae bacterium]